MLKKLIKLLTLLSAVSLVGCATLKKPKILIGVVNAPGKQIKYYRMDKDFSDGGYLIPGSKPIYRPAARIEDLNKHMCFTTEEDGPEEAIARLRAYIKKLREEYDRNCQPPR